MGKLKILIVDDNTDFCDSVRDVIELKGHDTLTAYNGAEAIKIVSEEHPDLAVLDIKMPGISGVVAFKEIKKIAPRTKVILMTGFALEEVSGEGLREKPLGFLKKPLNFEEFFALIDNLS